MLRVDRNIPSAPRPGERPSAVVPAQDQFRRIIPIVVWAVNWWRADYIHRAGRFRTLSNGELVDFTMPPFRHGVLPQRRGRSARRAAREPVLPVLPQPRTNR
jgi:hypothetical protein